MARTEKSVVVPFMRNRNAAEMGADADYDEPLVMAFLDARGIRLRIRQARDIDVAGFLDLFLGAVHDVDRLAAPEHLDVLSIGDRSEIDLDGGAGGDRRRIRVKLGH